ncbi:hypothetical protein BDN67DRAFT_962925 [Paxillus ammoniavirescens]|nr:hypothetical protein BDN67DRAFT_962925 [Paxillus ammoniavirescens]
MYIPSHASCIFALCTNTPTLQGYTCAVRGLLRGALAVDPSTLSRCGLSTYPDLGGIVQRKPTRFETSGLGDVTFNDRQLSVPIQAAGATPERAAGRDMDPIESSPTA